MPGAAEPAKMRDDQEGHTKSGGGDRRAGSVLLRPRVQCRHDTLPGTGKREREISPGTEAKRGAERLEPRHQRCEETGGTEPGRNRRDGPAVTDQPDIAIVQRVYSTGDEKQRAA